ncbi:DNA-binding protein [Kribbella speibonae]|uniref:DNA-binding protein n=1 Tax=Kribbella speibonae TaxID=1572660 RepID=A0A4R0J427_9ACTN|nr:DNA-binding protein [Kribbella speibonae]TCC27133.1 DNA-binding protein [Kribbella speibonae]TCC36015.1 DNA-binding protein [Kribbella speibonae]
MRRKQDAAATADQEQAERQREAREQLLGLGAKDLPARPWRPAPIPLSAVDLTQFAAWRAADLSDDDLLAALALLPAARAEVDEVEAGLLFMARSAGLTWAEMADAMGFSSPQACQQRFNRLTARQDS